MQCQQCNYCLDVPSWDLWLFLTLGLAHCLVLSGAQTSSRLIGEQESDLSLEPVIKERCTETAQSINRIRRRGEYAGRCLLHVPTNGKQQVHLQPFIFNVSGHGRIVNEKKCVCDSLVYSILIQMQLQSATHQTRLHEHMCIPTYEMLGAPSCFCVCACTLYLCLSLLCWGACQDSWEGSKGEVINQDRQEQHPGIPRMTMLLGAAGSSVQSTLWSEHQLRTVLLHSSADAGKTTFCSRPLHHTTRQRPRSV